MQSKRSGRRVAMLVSAFAVAIAFGACGGDDDEPRSVEEEIRDAIEDGNLEDVDAGDAADLPDVCEIVTRSDAERLFGVDAVEVEDASPVGLGASCIYENTDSDDLGTVGHLLQARIFAGEQFYGAEAIDGETAVDDLGDRAFVKTRDGAFGGVEVQFVQDGRTVTLDYSTVNAGVEDAADRVEAADREDQVVELARQASAQLASGGT